MSRVMNCLSTNRSSIILVNFMGLAVLIFCDKPSQVFNFFSKAKKSSASYVIAGLTILQQETPLIMLPNVALLSVK